MKITITASLTDIQANILAKKLGYSETIFSIVDINIPTTTEEIPNPETPFEFLKRVYENMIIEDATKHFIAHNDELNKVAWDTADKLIKDEIALAITSTVI